MRPFSQLLIIGITIPSLLFGCSPYYKNQLTQFEKYGYTYQYTEEELQQMREQQQQDTTNMIILNSSSVSASMVPIIAMAAQ